MRGVDIFNSQRDKGKEKMDNMDTVKRLGDYVRYLSAMAIQRANSGHPGLPLGCADIGVLLYSKFMKASAANPNWINRDRFILSAGHGSMLVYALNYLYGYDFSIKDIAHFRQLHSVTAGHRIRWQMASGYGRAELADASGF